MQSEIDKRPYAHECGKTNYIFCPACVYAEGRKSAEKDFKELLDIANRMVAPSGPKFQAVTDFMFWKNARGVK